MQAGQAGGHQGTRRKKRKRGPPNCGGRLDAPYFRIARERFYKSTRKQFMEGDVLSSKNPRRTGAGGDRRVKGRRKRVKSTFNCKIRAFSGLFVQAVEEPKGMWHLQGHHKPELFRGNSGHFLRFFCVFWRFFVEILGWRKGRSGLFPSANGKIC